MRIISDFHDYYDSVQATGQDQTLIYNRKREEAEVSEYPLPVVQWPIGRDDRVIQIQQHIIGFCGKIYPALALTQMASKKSAICYNLAEVDSFIENNCRKKEVEAYRTKPKRRWRFGYGWLHYLCRDNFEKYFGECAEKKDRYVEMFLMKRCPVWVGTVLENSWRRRLAKIVYNASLKELEFFRLFDTYTAFQEIAMFFGGMAVPLKEIPQVPDKIMVGIKGFDEWSFRKPPQEK